MTSNAVRLAATCSVAALALAGCGSDSSLDRDTAMQHAMNAVVREVGDPGSTIYHHRLELHGADAYGDGGWLVRIADRTDGTRICVTDLPTQTAVGPTENISVAACGGPPSAPPPPRPADTA